MRLLELNTPGIFSYYIISGNPVLIEPTLFNDFSFGFWSLTNSQSSGGDIGSVDYYNEYDFANSIYVPQYPVGWAINARTTTDEINFRVNSEFEYTVPNTNSRGLFIASRLNATEMTISRNGVVLATPAEPSKAWPTSSFGSSVVVGQGSFGGPRSFVGGVWQRPASLLYGSFYTVQDVVTPSNREYCLHWLGKGLTPTEQLALFNRLRDYLLLLIPSTDLGV
jgi:hypothetical protein